MLPRCQLTIPGCGHITSGGRCRVIALAVAWALTTPANAAAQAPGIDFHHDADLLSKLSRGDTASVWRGEWSLLSVMIAATALDNPIACSLVERKPAISPAAVAGASDKALRDYPDVALTLYFRGAHPVLFELVSWMDVHGCESPRTQTMLENLLTLYVTRTHRDGWKPQLNPNDLSPTLTMTAVAPWPLTIAGWNPSDEVRSALVAATQAGYKVLSCTYTYGTSVVTHYAWLFRLPGETLVPEGTPIAMVGMAGCPPGGFSGVNASAIPEMMRELVRQPGDRMPHADGLQAEDVVPFIEPGNSRSTFPSNYKLRMVNEGYTYLDDPAAARDFPNPYMLDPPGQQLLACRYDANARGAATHYWKDALPAPPTGSEPNDDWAAYLAGYFSVLPVALRHCPPNEDSAVKFSGWVVWMKPPRS